MVAVKGVLVKELVPAASVGILALLEAGLLGELLEVGNIMRSVAALEDGVGSRSLLLALPEEVAAQRLGELSGQHVAAGGSGRESSLGMDVVDGSDNGLGTGARDLADGLQVGGAHALHHERALVRVVGGGTQGWAARSSAGAHDCRSRVGGSVAEGLLALILSKHQSDERGSRDQVGLGLDALEKLFVHARLAAVLHRVFPVGGIIIVVNGALVNIVVISVRVDGALGLQLRIAAGGHHRLLHLLRDKSLCGLHIAFHRGRVRRAANLEHALLGEGNQVRLGHLDAHALLARRARATKSKLGGCLLLGNGLVGGSGQGVGDGSLDGAGLGRLGERVGDGNLRGRENASLRGGLGLGGHGGGLGRSRDGGSRNLLLGCSKRIGGGGCGERSSVLDDGDDHLLEVVGADVAVASAAAAGRIQAVYPGAENLKRSGLGSELGGVLVNKGIDAAGKLRKVLGAGGDAKRRGCGGVGLGSSGVFSLVVLNELLSLPESPAEVF